MICHIALFVTDIPLFADKRITMPKFRAVTVTLSYRMLEPEPEPKKEPLKPKKIITKEAVKIPDKPKPLPPKEPLPTPVEPKPSPPEEKVEVMEPDELIGIYSKEELLEESQGDDIANMHVYHEAIPLYKRNPPPKYPRAARRRGYEGTVILNVLVNKNGDVSSLWVSTSSGYRLLDNAALEAVSNWLFEPGSIGNKKVDMWVKIPVRFQLK